jgi:hypothetical protein
MKRMIRPLALLAVIASVALLVPSHVFAREGFRHSSQSSVFPQPRDPYRSWGVRTELPRRVGSPYDHDHGDFHRPVKVWVPGHWSWNGYGWVWWPGHWGYAR